MRVEGIITQFVTVNVLSRRTNRIGYYLKVAHRFKANHGRAIRMYRRDLASTRGFRRTQCILQCRPNPLPNVAFRVVTKAFRKGKIREDGPATIGRLSARNFNLHVRVHAMVLYLLNVLLFSILFARLLDRTNCRPVVVDGFGSLKREATGALITEGGTRLVLTFGNQ